MNVGDFRRCKSGAKRNVQGTLGICATVDRIEQAGTALKRPYFCDPVGTVRCDHEKTGNGNRLIRERKFGLAELGYQFSKVEDCQCIYGEKGVCLPYGNDDWVQMNEYWRSHILPTIKDSCHQRHRFDPVSWMWCAKGLDFAIAKKFTTMVYNNTNYHLLLDPLYRSWFDQHSIFAPDIWDKFKPDSAMGVRAIGMLLLIWLI